MAEDSLKDILQLIKTDGIGPVTFYNYVKKAGSVRAALQLAAQKKTLCPREIVEEEIALCAAKGIHIITYDDSRYPAKLAEINDAPPVLYALGNPELLQHPRSIAIVGARNASIAGRKMASRLAYELTNSGVMVISGMARGIDGAAHKGALYAANQQGATIAVVGTGVDEIYPQENSELYTQIINQGVVISELSPGTKAQIANFPRRNRIIAALSDGIVVVEAGLHSGSLITAKLGLEQGKEIFAVPGSPTENRSAGPNQLIKEGAVLTSSSEDILNALSSLPLIKTKKAVISEKPLDKVQNSVNISEHQTTTFEQPSEKVNLLDYISYEGVDADELLRTCGLSTTEFFLQLTDLEFAGKIERQVGNKVAKIK